jgi:hypothetical protein
MTSDDQFDDKNAAAHRLPTRIRIVIAAMPLFIAVTGLAPGIAALTIMRRVLLR